jgi:SAM-dependent methyltransferase
LTFPNRSFGLICTNDVLEHVADYKAALRECFRCLRPGGHLVVTVPFMLLSQETQIRARVASDGSLEHLTEPEYHNDPLSPQGVLCFYNYGWDLLDEIKNAGFEDARVRLYWSLRRGYLGVPQTFITAQRG